MGYDCCDFFARNARSFCVCQMILQGLVNGTRRHQRYNCYDASGFHVNIFIVPNFPKQHIIIQMCEFRRKFSQRVSSRSLCNLCHLITSLYSSIECSSKIYIEIDPVRQAFYQLQRPILQVPDHHHVSIIIRLLFSAVKNSEPAAAETEISVFPSGLCFQWIIDAVSSGAAVVRARIRAAETARQTFCKFICRQSVV